MPSLSAFGQEGSPLPLVRRAGATAATLVATCLLVALVPASAAAQEPPGINRFMSAVGEVESHGRYDARNSQTGAIGKYQIMPSNWPGWAKKYIGDASAKPTPQNQERVARGKFTDLWNWLDSWPAVAHWWLTGSGERDVSKWSSYSTRYVAKVMKLMATAPDQAPDPATPTPNPTPTPTPPASAPPGTPPPASTPPQAPIVAVYDDANLAIVWAGAWSVASYRSYSRGAVRYARTPGAKATLAFTGRMISWIGPIGPTRGRARVYVDGTLVRTIDLGASGFTARRTLFSATWATSGAHTIQIEVVAAAGRPVVAIDELRVVR